MPVHTKSLLLAGVAAALLALPANAADPYGTWVRPSTGTQVNFYDCGGKLCAKIVSVKDEARKKNVGTVIIKGMPKIADNKWEGDLLDVESGKVYSGVATLESASALNLKGCVAMVLCKGETWRKVK